MRYILINIIMNTIIPPHNESIEKALVGAMILYPDEDFSQLERDDFYNPIYSIISNSIILMKEVGTPIDLVTIYNEISDKWISIREMSELTEGTFTWTNIPQYIKTLKEFRRKREWLKIALEITHFADWDPAKMVDYANKLSLASTIGMSAEDSVSYDDVNSAYEQIVSRFGKSLYWYSWWRDFAFLDEFTKGIMKKKVYRIGAPSNTGKTQFIYDIIPDLLEQKNEDWTYVKIAFFTLENTKEDTLVSLMCNQWGLNAAHVNSGEIEWNWDYLTSLKDRLYIIDDVYDLDKIFSKVISIAPDIVILDYITHVTIAKASWYEKYDMYAERVPKFAKSQNVAWIDLSNLPKNLQTNEEIRATPWFFWSSILMNNCDVAFHLMKNPEFKKTKETLLKNISAKREDKTYFYTRACLDMLITKNRWGSVFVEKTFWINFQWWGKWKELSEMDLNALWAKYW